MSKETPYISFSRRPVGSREHAFAYASNVDTGKWTGSQPSGHRLTMDAWLDRAGVKSLGLARPARLKVYNAHDELIFEACATDYRFADVPVTGDLWVDMNALWNACVDERCLQLAIKTLF